MDPSLLIALRIIAVLLLVALNAFFVAAEFALVSVRWTRVEALVKERRFGAQLLQGAVERLDDSIAATQLGITIASIALGWVGEPALAHLFEPAFTWLPGIWSAISAHAVAVALAFMLITFLHVVLGELAPKAIALQRAEDVGLIVAAPLLLFGKVFRPFITIMNGAGNWVVKQLRLPPPEEHKSVHSVDELLMLVEESEEAGVVPEDQADYVENVFTLTRKKVRDVMVPRENVVALKLDASPEEVLSVAREHAHTRMPVWEGDLDNIVGIVNTKDLFHLFSLKGVVILMDALYPALFVDPDQPVAQLLTTFKRERRPMAVVRGVDGRFVGMVTLEDILEEIVGEIEDEHDQPVQSAAMRRRVATLTRAGRFARRPHPARPS